MNRILMDTNIYSHALRGNPDVTAVLRQVSHIGFAAISIGELLSGFKGGRREQENRRELMKFLDSPRVTVYSISEVTAEYYSHILNQLKKKGNPIPTNDIWIAAVAFQHGLPIYTMDQHFSCVEGLLLK